MSDVIDVMEDAIDLTGDIVTALKVAEEHGWRLVPVEPTKEMVASIEDHADGFGPSVVWHQAVGSAPRPWDDA